MKRSMFILVLFFYFCAFIQMNAQNGGITFYSFNTAFEGMKIKVITPEGKVYSSKWEFIRYDSFLKRNEYKNIFFPTNGKNCIVQIYFKNYKNKICRASFLLNNLNYSGRYFSISMPAYSSAPVLFSNWGPFEENVRLVSVWRYPWDDLKNPQIRLETKSALYPFRGKTPDPPYNF